MPFMFFRRSMGRMFLLSFLIEINMCTVTFGYEMQDDGSCGMSNNLKDNLLLAQTSHSHFSYGASCLLWISLKRKVVRTNDQ